LGLRAVAVYSEADAQAMHVRLADEAVYVGPPPPSESYLRGDLLIAAAQQTHCEAIHPGFGFLSENATFAEAVHQAGLTFIGPKPETMRAMGSKTSAREVMAAAGVPIVPGYQASQAEADLVAAAAEIGYPVLVKASAGGGGKGMRLVEQPADLVAAMGAAKREALKAFGDDQIYLEKYIRHPHHIEFQVFGDNFGQAFHLFERECSIQRRHQKIVEETPSPLLTENLRQRMAEAAVQAVQAVNYVNAGTLEFLVDGESYDFYFLEMNTRLQVEHPITEMVVGVDLVKAQLRVAAGERLQWSALRQHGHAIECRLYAEDPANQFLPSTGKLWQVIPPHGPNIRFDSGIGSGDEVTRHYDPMLAKLIVWAENRAEAIRKMDWALRHTVILGEVVTNIPFLRAVINHPAFQQGDTPTDFIERYLSSWQPATELPTEVLIAAALSETLITLRPLPATRPTQGADVYSPWLQPSGFRLGQ
jgi:acetyl/propionyl-CoA carboxylase alpha subunit